MQSTGSVTEKIINGVATITFEHPFANSLTSTLLRQLSSSINDAASQHSVHVIVVQSGGDGAFCGGASFEELANIQTPEAGIEFFMGFADVILSIKQSGKPVIVVAQGKAVGGAVGLLAGADWTIAHPSIQVRLSELALGIGPFTISPAVIRKIGLARFQELTLGTEWKDARWCQHTGLCTTIVSSGSNTADVLANQIAAFKSYDLEAFAENKKLLWNYLPVTREQFLLRAKQVSSLLLAPYAQARIKSLKEKRS